MKIRQTSTRSGRFFRENHSSDDTVFTRNLKIPKLHRNNPLFSIELVAIAQSTTPSEKWTIEINTNTAQNLGVSEANSVTAINTEVVNKLIYIKVLLHMYYIFI